MAKILVVDDIPANRTLVATLVGYRGHQVLEAADGAEALALVRAERPALVISDILMPTMDGFEFVRRLRADPELAATEVIFYSAHYRERETHNLARACGVTRVLIKPCEPEDILRAIDDALAHAPGFALAPDVQEFDREHVRLMTDKLSEKVAELEAANARLGALTELNLQLASERDPRVMLEKVCRGARELVVAKYAVLCVQGGNGGAMIFYTSGIEVALAARLEPPELGRGIMGEALDARMPRRIANPGGAGAAAVLPAGYPAFESALVAPVISLSRAYGWIFLADKLGASGFSAEDEHLLAIHAAQAGRIFENGSLYAEVQRHAGRLELEIVERKRTAEELRASEAMLNRAQVMARLTHVITGPDGEFESWPETMPRLIGTDKAGVPADTRGWLGLVHPDDRALFRDKVIEAGVREARTDLEYRLRRADGTWLQIRQVMEPMLGLAEPHVRGRWFNTIQDITEQKQAESRIRRLNRVYAVLSGINTLIVRVRDRDELFHESCRIAVEHGQFKMAWIGVVDREAMKIVPNASVGAEPEFLALVRDSFSLNEGDALGNTMSARAVRERIAIVSNDMQHDPRTLFATKRSDRGVAAMAVLPLLVAGEAVGVLALYAGEVGFFDAEEMKLLAELAGDIAFALEKLAGAAAMRESEARYQTLFDASPDAIRVSCDGQIVMANPAYLRLLGVPAGQSLAGRDAFSHLPAAWRERGMARSRAVLVERIAAPLLEMEFVRDDGESVPVEVTTLPFTYQGKPAALSIMHDLSGRNANLRSLKEAELRYRSLVETSLNGVIILDGETIEYANPTFAHKLGFTSPAAAVGTGILSLLEPEFRERVRRNIQKLGTHVPQSVPAIHLRMRRLDGGTMYVQASAASIVLAGRTLVQAEMRDITRERRALAEIRALNRSLEARVAERTAELTLANRDLAAANSDLESFSYSVAHDLRAPLRTMDGFANLLALDVAAGAFAEVPRHVDRIARNAARMNELIDGLLAVARVTHGALAEDRVDFALLVAQIVQDARPADHVLVELGALPVVRGDISALRQLWTNLISNALKYSAKRDRPEVRVMGEPAGAEFVFHVRDNGAGFDPGYASRLFGVFQRLHPAQEFEGTGVGLAVVRRVAERHGGRVWAEGKPGGGATFHFSLPLARIEMPAME
jgi:PAS domain S-box-containing protein